MHSCTKKQERNNRFMSKLSDYTGSSPHISPNDVKSLCLEAQPMDLGLSQLALYWLTCNRHGVLGSLRIRTRREAIRASFLAGGLGLFISGRAQDCLRLNPRQIVSLKVDVETMQLCTSVRGQRLFPA